MNDYTKATTSLEEVAQLPDPSYRAPPGFLQVSIGQVNHILHFNDSLAHGTIRIDGSWQKSSKRYGVGWTIDRYNTGELEAGGNSGVAASALQPELLACSHALRWAKDNGYRSIKVLTDCASLVTTLKSKRPLDIHIYWTWKDIITIGSTFQHCIILKVDRAHVNLSHRIANQCRTILNCFSNTVGFDFF